jgi:sarcosine/dimethylglycine N-methyltransferase
MKKEKRDAATAQVREFYDGPADRIYRTTWGENLHLGLPLAGGSRYDAMVHATDTMAAAIDIDENTTVLDLGAGYGGPARQLVSRFGCRVTGLNLSQVEIEEAQKQTRAAGVDDRVTYVLGDFHDLEFADASFDVVWSQDSLMYGADKCRILQEARRVLRPGGVLDFTDILAKRDLAPSERDRLYGRVRTPEMWDVERYRQELAAVGFTIERVEDWSEHVADSYAAAQQEAMRKRNALESQVGRELVERTIEGLSFWVEMAKLGNVGWAWFVARKPQ